MLHIYQATSATDSIVEAFARLIPQLADNLPAPTVRELQAVIDSQGSTLLIAEYDGRIVGTTTLLVYTIPTGTKARIEDVIVDDAVRGKGVAMALMQAAIELTRSQGISKLDLTSSHFRTAAHRLYEKCGFVMRDTGVFRLDINLE